LASKAVVFIAGKLSWAKVLGEPVPNYSKDGREWTFELEPDEKGLKTLLGHGLADRVKGKGYNIGTKGQHAERQPFLQFKRPEFGKDGSANDHIRIYDADDQKWDSETLIGNGSGSDVKLDIRDYGVGKKKGVYPVAIRVTDHIPYESSEFGGMASDDDTPKKKTVKKDTFKEDFNLDDEVPV